MNDRKFYFLKSSEFTLIINFSLFLAVETSVEFITQLVDVNTRYGQSE